MDPATVIALCKENIQPLRHGRNATQLGTALRAQEDSDAQQMLQQEKHMYEEAIKNYQGEDPLENWYDYILWVEQSFPRSGHDSHIGRLLQQCLATFEKETKYHQDRRFIRLWINYISMQKNPLELYQLLHHNGIGTMVADMYRAWAFEFEQNEDYKRADEIYSMGVAAHAQPYEELTCAQTNFQLAVARKMLGHRDERGAVALAEQRQAFSSLRAIRGGKKVGSIRTGQRVRDYLPGSLPQVYNPSELSRENARIQIYQDDLPGTEHKGSSILDHVPIEESVHKENSIKPGPWSSASKRGPLIPSTIKTSFKVHEDHPSENDMDKLRLFPNHTPFFDGSKYHEHLHVPVFVPDPPSSEIIRKVHYPKDLVYADNVDLSMEEIRAQKYMKRAKQSLSKSNPKGECEIGDQRYEMVQNNHRESDENRKRLTEELSRLERQRQEAEQLELEQQRHIQQQRREAEQRALERQRELERQRFEAEQRELERRRLEAERIEAERIEAERMEAERMEAELNRQQKIHSSRYMNQHHRAAVQNNAVEHLLGQSITVNTKEAMSVVQDLWHSPDQNASSVSMPGNGINHGLVEPRGKLVFDIHMDSSMTQHAITGNKHHQQYNMQPYSDQENHQHYPPTYTSPEHQSPYGNHAYNAYHYQMQPHHQPHVQHQPHIQPPHMQQHVQPQQHHQQQQPQHHHHHHQQHHQQHSISTQQQQQQHHPSTHMQHQQQQQHQQHHHIYGNISANSSIGYQSYHSAIGSPPTHDNRVEPQKQVQFTPYIDPDVESSKPYKMPSELPYIKSPGMNRRDLKYLEGAEDKENAISVDYNGPLEDEAGPKQSEQDNLYVDESLGITPLTSENETCFTQAFNNHLTASTPITNHFRHSYRGKETQQFQEHDIPSQGPTETRSCEGEENKLSVIMESTREYVSSSSGSSGAHTRTPGLGFTLTREDLLPIKEQSTSQDMESTEFLLAANQTYEQKMRAQIQAVHAQSPRTVQRNVDQITSEIKNSCDLRKAISFKPEKDDSMEFEEHEPMEEVEEETFELPTGDINPFDKGLITGLLRKIKFPQPHHAVGYTKLDSNINKFVPSTMVTLGTEAYDLEKCLGKGTYGTVYKGINLQTGQAVALKTQKPAWVWEYYIAREIKARLTNPHMLRGFMDITTAYVANNASTLVSEFSKYGTLLAVANQVKLATGKQLGEPLAIFFTIEMLQIVEYLHKCQIIHGDIKPDNFLLMHLPSDDVRPTIQLIDFGCSIDMSLFPESTKFTHVIKTEDFTCIEMQTGKPWTYQTDLYCLAASSHCLLFGNYMRVSNNNGRWFINSKIPRYVKKAAWERYFTELLNIESCDKMPDLTALRNVLEETLSQVSDLRAFLRSFSNTLNKR
ncbi:uncharacterized protein LOC124305212 [Neodiprion virginianus]|uniref:uncharacterized protein LOC124305212 n=1 Tax=Neodiprion virginianus TaxID=2961670 RepID=UPI001EE774FA|nr:uncharacterized protein LOC124305212 [Neodiprion virginianus]XP_046620323.1 uncharacterized protein LOC124305212 [Neodiprion virginianus]